MRDVYLAVTILVMLAIPVLFGFALGRQSMGADASAEAILVLLMTVVFYKLVANFRED